VQKRSRYQMASGAHGACSAFAAARARRAGVPPLDDVTSTVDAAALTQLLAVETEMLERP